MDDVTGADPTPTPPAATPAPSPERSAVDLDAVAADLAAVNDALTRLDEGTYGRCAACDAPIDDDALATEPTRLTCDAHLPV